MRKTLLVARWEFMSAVTRRAYVFAVVAMPLFYGGLVFLAGLAGRSATAGVFRIPTAIVDPARIVDLDLARDEAARRDREAAPDPFRSAAAVPTAALVAYTDLGRALDALRAGEVAAVFAIDAEYRATGAITAYSRESGLFAQQTDRQRMGQVADAIRAGLLKTVVPGEALARAYAPTARVKRMRLDSRGIVAPVSDPTGLGPFAGALGVFLLFTMAIFFSAGFLGQATIEDRQNRMIEILCASVDPHELVLGKIMGLGAAGLLQVGIYLALVIVPGVTVFQVLQVPLAKLALMIVYFVLGYLVFACVMTWTGMIGRTPQEAGQMGALWLIAAASPMGFIANISSAPNGPIARTLSFIPLTTPVTMMLRIAGPDVPVWDFIVSIAIELVAI